MNLFSRLNLVGGQAYVNLLTVCEMAVGWIKTRQGGEDNVL